MQSGYYDPSDISRRQRSSYPFKKDMEGFSEFRVLDQHLSLKLSITDGSGAATFCSISSAGEYVAGAFEHTVKLWFSHNGKLIAVLDQHEAPVARCEFIPGTNLLLAVSKDGTLVVWDVARKLRKLSTRCDLLYTGGWDPPNEMFVPTYHTGGNGKYLVVRNGEQCDLWSLTGGHLLQSRRGQSCAISGQADLMAISDDDQVLGFDLTDNSVLFTLNSDAAGDWRRSSPVVGLDPKGDYLAVCSDEEVCLVDTHNPSQLQRYKGPWRPYHCAFHREGKYFLVLGGFPARDTPDEGRWVDDSALYYIEPPSDASPRASSVGNPLPRRPIIVGLEAVWREGKEIGGSLLCNDRVFIWNRNELNCHEVRSRALLSTMTTASPILDTVEDPSQRHIAIITHSGAVVIDTQTAAVIRQGAQGFSKSCFANADGKRIGSIASGHEAWIWNLWTDEIVYVLRGHSMQITCCASAPRRARFLTGSQDNTLMLWDTQSGKCQRLFTGFDSSIEACWLTEDAGQFVAAVAEHVVCVNAHSAEIAWSVPVRGLGRNFCGTQNTLWCTGQMDDELSSDKTTSAICLDMQTGQQLAHWNIGEEIECHSLTLNRQGNLLLVGGNTIKSRNEYDYPSLGEGLLVLLAVH